MASIVGPDTEIESIAYVSETKTLTGEAEIFHKEWFVGSPSKSSIHKDGHWTSIMTSCSPSVECLSIPPGSTVVVSVSVGSGSGALATSEHT